MSSGVEQGYRVRYSARAKRLILKVDAWGGVEVVAPQGVKDSAVALFVSKHAQWVSETQARVHARRTVPVQHGEVPQTVALAALDEQWRVVWQPEAIKGFRVRQATHELVVSGVAAEQVPGVLQAWLQRHATRQLLPWLAEVAAECGIDYAKAGVRAQRSRWGSCSSRGHISLNRNLLFLSPDVVRYLFVHELSHIEQANHSPRFWALVAEHMPDYKVYDRVLRHGWDHVPRWAWPQR